MIHALGYSETTFSPCRPGRLCRGRERWIEPWTVDDADADAVDGVWRLVLSGAAFEDDSAARASRGLPFTQLDLAHIIHTLLPRRELLAFCEDGHPADIPVSAEAVELYTGHRAGGRSEDLRVRWVMRASGLQPLRTALGAAEDPRVLGFLWLRPEVDPTSQAVLDALYLLTGMGTLDSPPARFQPAALPDLFALARAVVLLHRDKHGPAIGVYAPEPLDGAAARVVAEAEAAGTLAVPFAIPPMLARWDRALAEARSRWLETRSDPFPVPAAPEPAGRGGRGAGSRARDALDRRGRAADLAEE